MRFVMIEWLDSGQPLGEWQYIENLRPGRAHRCVTVGHLLHETADAVTVALSVATADGTDRPGQASGVAVIPQRSITAVRNLKPV